MDVSRPVYTYPYIYGITRHTYVFEYHTGFVNNAIKAAPSPVTFILVPGENTSVNVKRLPKKEAPKRFGRKLTEGQKERATHVCVDCGYVYTDE